MAFQLIPLDELPADQRRNIIQLRAHYSHICGATAEMPTPNAGADKSLHTFRSLSRPTQVDIEFDRDLQASAAMGMVSFRNVLRKLTMQCFLLVSGPDIRLTRVWARQIYNVIV